MHVLSNMVRSFRWLWLVVLLCCATSGCSCQSVGLQVPGDTNTNTTTGGQKQPPAETPEIVDITTSAQKYQVQGVATLTFYPKEQTGQEGSFGGYVLVYDKPQETNVQFASLRDGECKFSKFDTSEPRESITFRGLDAGRLLNVRLAEHQWTWDKKPFLWGEQEAGVYYLGTSVEKMRYPYEGTVSLEAKGGADVESFTRTWQAPAHLEVKQPVMKPNESIRVSRESAFPLQWKFTGKAPYLAVRINQNDPDGKTVRSLTCRFAPGGPGTIPKAEMARFKVDPDGLRTYVFFFAGRYLLARLPKYEKPLFIVMEAISSSSVVIE